MEDKGKINRMKIIVKVMDLESKVRKKKSEKKRKQRRKQRKFKAFN